MGNRANIAVLQHGAPVEDGRERAVYLYSHWGGYDLPQTLQEALKRGQDRWRDEQYLARVIFCEMVRGDLDGLTGYGITDCCWDNEHAVIEVDCEKQQVSIGEQRWSFPDYTAADLADLSY